MASSTWDAVIAASLRLVPAETHDVVGRGRFQIVNMVEVTHLQRWSGPTFGGPSPMTMCRGYSRMLHFRPYAADPRTSGPPMAGQRGPMPW